MRIHTDDTSFVYLRGVAPADAGDADGAIADLTKAIETDPGTGTAYVRRGRVVPRPKGIRRAPQPTTVAP